MFLIELSEHLEEGLIGVVSLLKITLEATSLLCVAFGLVTTIKLALSYRFWRGNASFLSSWRDRTSIFSSLRLRFGRWLTLALEFQLGSDIVATTVAPTFESLGKLAVIAVIRTFLNYFLEKELETEAAKIDNQLPTS